MARAGPCRLPTAHVEILAAVDAGGAPFPLRLTWPSARLRLPAASVHVRRRTREEGRGSMKNVHVLTIAFGLTLVVGAASAADKSNVGCGVGTMIFEGKEGVLSRACAATTNGLFGNQTFGITSGTLECAKPASFTSNERLNKFVGDNMANLAMDMSKGSGEYLTTLAVLMDVPVAERAQLYQRLQANFAKIYTSPSVTQVDVLNNIEAVLATS